MRMKMLLVVVVTAYCCSHGDGFVDSFQRHAIQRTPTATATAATGRVPTDGGQCLHHVTTAGEVVVHIDALGEGHDVGAGEAGGDGGGRSGTTASQRRGGNKRLRQQWRSTALDAIGSSGLLLQVVLLVLMASPCMLLLVLVLVVVMKLALVVRGQRPSAPLRESKVLIHPYCNPRRRARAMMCGAMQRVLLMAAAAPFDRVPTAEAEAVRGGVTSSCFSGRTVMFC